jgi:hypothetical protein
MGARSAVGSALAVVLLLASSGIAVAGDVASFTGTILLESNMRMPAGRTYQLTMNVEKWTPPQDIEHVLVDLKEGGQEAALKDLQKMKAGYIIPPDWARQPSWRVAIATMHETPKGTVVRMITDRPIALFEAMEDTRSEQYKFGVAEFTLNAKGTGEGLVVPAAKINFDKKGQLVIETLPHSTGPQKLIGIKAWDWDKDKKKK